MTTIQSYSDNAKSTVKWQAYPGADLNHAALGLADESGEFASAVKSHLIYGKPLDKINLIEELGDTAWFVNLGALAIGVPLEVVLKANTAKLQVRYSAGYSDAKALGRAPELERAAIQKVLDEYEASAGIAEASALVS